MQYRLTFSTFALSFNVYVYIYTASDALLSFANRHYIGTTNSFQSFLYLMVSRRRRRPVANMLHYY